MITIWADNEKAVEKASDTWIPNNATNQDIRRHLRSILKEIQSPIQFCWVEGHQDGNTTPTVLSLPATMNIQADTLAKNIWKSARLQGILTVLP